MDIGDAEGAGGRGPVTTSVFELYKVGPGPSSSHTLGPMRAAGLFLDEAAKLPPEALDRATGLRVRLLGSLSATGRGHGTDRAVLAGLLGQKPETCDSALLDSLLVEPGATYTVTIGKKTLFVRGSDVVFGAVLHDRPFNNTLVFELLGPEGVLLSKEYYSVGGGFVQWPGWKEPERGKPAHPYASMRQLRILQENTGLPLHRMLLENEQALTGAGEAEILERLDATVEAMLDSVARGLADEGILPGPIRLQRKARAMDSRINQAKHPIASFFVRLSAYAVAASEENAAGHRIVTAPTSGSAGVLPALVRTLKDLDCNAQALREGLLSAAAVGFLAKHNASIAGAEVGCQGEIGVASAMGAALLADAWGDSPGLVEDSAAIALEHHLGLTCDPVGGYVQIPCIERCAMGAVKAATAFLIAAAQPPGSNRVGYDAVVQAMAETGRDMSSKYKETAQGGLAVHLVNC